MRRQIGRTSSSHKESSCLEKASEACPPPLSSFHFVVSLGMLASVGTAHAVTNSDLAFHYAPVHCQDTDSSDYPSDYITAFDYDSDRISTNNWDNRSSGQWPATAYFSVVESCSHYFITYSFFHPRDWSEHDLRPGARERSRRHAARRAQGHGHDLQRLEGMDRRCSTPTSSFAAGGRCPLTNGQRDHRCGTESFEVSNGVSRPEDREEAGRGGAGFRRGRMLSDFTVLNQMASPTSAFTRSL